MKTVKTKIQKKTKLVNAQESGNRMELRKINKEDAKAQWEFRIRHHLTEATYGQSC